MEDVPVDDQASQDASLSELYDDKALYEFIRSDLWQQCRALLRLPDAARFVRHDDDRLGGSVLLQACLQNGPFDVVRSVLALAPDRALMRGCSFRSDFATSFSSSGEETAALRGSTPLYFACGGASEAVVALLVRAAPTSATISSDFSDTMPLHDQELPLHRAVCYRRSHNCVRMLLQVHPTAVYAVNRMGYTPLRIFVNIWNTDVERLTANTATPHTFTPGNNLDNNMDGLVLVQKTFVLLLKAHVHGTLDEKDEEDDLWLPLHEALRARNIIPPCFCFLPLLDRTVHTKCIRHDKERNFALHLACGR